jgi:tyrosinase
MFERRDVWELSEEDPWHPTIEWYARAITAMQDRDGTDFSDPTSWRYLANIHGVDREELPRSSWPQGATWNECQHNSWFFLPWHRIYLHYFEQVVRQTIADLGGPDDWALPYWDYSDPDRENVRRLPPAFREPQMPSGDPNPLRVSQRRTTPFDINQGGELPPFVVDTGDAMAMKFFSRLRIDVDPRPEEISLATGFGGPRTGWNHAEGRPGVLEVAPHGFVHGGVGGTEPLGLMSLFETAARDPIFWLHHANIDRLWEAWLALGDPSNPDSLEFRNPHGRSGERWLNMWFKVGGGASAVILRVREVLDTTQPPLSYRYSNISLPAPAPAVLAASADTESRFSEEEPVPQQGPEDTFPELVGASEDRVPLAAAPTEVDVDVGAPTGPALMAEGDEGAQPRRVYLKVENVSGKTPAAAGYLVYVNLPPGADPTTDPATYEDRRVGQVTMFGVREASEGNEEHSGSGLTFSFDITGLVQRLQEAGEWDPQRLRVTFTPVLAGAEQGGDVSVGRVSLFYV